MRNLDERLIYRIQGYPSSEQYKLMHGYRYTVDHSESRFLQDLIREKFSKFSQQERDKLIQKYDDEMTLYIYKKAGRITDKCRFFLYDKLKYKKFVYQSKPNYRELDKVFNVIFTSGSEIELAPLCMGLPIGLANNIFDFNRNVKKILK